ncbi:RNA polymerase sigma-70 factor [Chitinophaga agrisoli]|uniref:RNA polymerase sigma-70 factor n=1 Tax=Chitinophaga agrisoli TaxID=2607653 RepID=A0A5B2VRD9_9BACT|nr:RNA polymerase sigma-70 factor [Chitinophaga agrisoli]KAA2241374.1 RNA polymerase sigma-70 factor [Chitinophaga agrisoli]
MFVDNVNERIRPAKNDQMLTDEIQENAYKETQLFNSIAAGNESAFRELFEMYRERLFIFARQLSHSTVEAEEVVQDIFLKLWENRAHLSEISYPKKYIYTMARNRALDLLTSIARNKKAVQMIWANISASNNLTEELLQAQESQQLIYKAIAQLPEKKQAIFWLSRRDGLSHQEIAQQLGISVQTVKNNLTDILKYVRIYLSGHSELLTVAICLLMNG